MKHLLILLTSLVLPLTAQETLPLEGETFDIDGNKAVIHAAPVPAEGKPWLWYAPALNGGVSIVGRPMYFEAFMQAGLAIAGFDLGEVRGSPASSAKFTLFYEEMP